jgi:hypothetical protein
MYQPYFVAGPYLFIEYTSDKGTTKIAQNYNTQGRPNTGE